MSLRLRRGLEAERFNPITQTGPVFEEGEVIYITDTKEVYVGDGITPGGIRVTGDVEGSPPSLTRNLDITGFDITGNGNISVASVSGNGSGLTNLPIPYDSITTTFTGNFNGQFVGDGSGLTNLAQIDLEGTTQRINLLGSDSTLVFDLTSRTFYGNFDGNFIGFGGDLTNLNPNNINLTNTSQKINIVGLNDTVLTDITNNTHYGAFVGDGSGLSNVAPPNLDFTTYEMNIQGYDSTIIVNTATNTFTGIFVGDGSGLINVPGTGANITDTVQQISIRSVDGSSLLLDHNSGIHFGTFIGDGSQLTNLPVSIPNLDFTAYKMNIIGGDDTTIVDSATNTFTGIFVGNGSGLINVPSTPVNLTDTVQQISIRSVDGSSLLLDHNSGIHFGTFVGDGSQLTNLPVSIPNLDFTAYKMNIIGGDDTTIVDSATKTFTGVFVGDGSGLINVPSTPVNLTDTVQQISIRSIDGSSLLLDHDSGTHFGTFIGDGSQLTNLPVSIPNLDFTAYKMNIIGGDDTTIVDSATKTFTGIFNGVYSGDGSQLQFIQVTDQELSNRTLPINIISQDGSTLLVDTLSDSFQGNFFGDHFGVFSGDGSQLTNLPIPNYDLIINQNPWNINITDEGSSIVLDANDRVFFGSVMGDINGSVFGDDSTLLVDSVGNTLNAVSLTTGMIALADNRLTFEKLTGDRITELRLESYQTRNRFNINTVDKTGDLSAYTGFYGTLNFGYQDATTDRADATIRGSRADMRFAHDTVTTFISDETKYFTLKEGNFGFGTYTPEVKLDVRGPIRPGVYADIAARDTSIPTPIAGMTIFVTNGDGAGNPKFQGNLDGTTGGWVNLN